MNKLYIMGLVYPNVRLVVSELYPYYGTGAGYTALVVDQGGDGNGYGQGWGWGTGSRLGHGKSLAYIN